MFNPETNGMGHVNEESRCRQGGGYKRKIMTETGTTVWDFVGLKGKRCVEGSGDGLTWDENTKVLEPA